MKYQMIFDEKCSKRLSGSVAIGFFAKRKSKNGSKGLQLRNK